MLHEAFKRRNKKNILTLLKKGFDIFAPNKVYLFFFFLSRYLMT